MPVARAEDADASRKAAAKAQYGEAEHAFNGGDYRRAAELFESAYKAYPHHSSLWSAARAWMHANENVRAANLLEHYLREAPAKAPDRDRATAAINELDRKLGRIQFQIVDATDVKLDGERVTTDRIWVVPGEHVATASSQGRPIRKAITVAAGNRVAVTIEYANDKPDAATPARTSKPLPPWVFFVGAGATVVGGGLIVWSGLDALDARDAALKTLSQASFDHAHALERRTNIIIGSTIGLGVLTAITAFFVDWSGGESKSSTAVRTVPRGIAERVPHGMKVRFLSVENARVTKDLPTSTPWPYMDRRSSMDSSETASHSADTLEKCR